MRTGGKGGRQMLVFVCVLVRGCNISEYFWRPGSLGNSFKSFKPFKSRPIRYGRLCGSFLHGSSCSCSCSCSSIYLTIDRSIDGKKWVREAGEEQEEEETRDDDCMCVYVCLVVELNSCCGSISPSPSPSSSLLFLLTSFLPCSNCSDSRLLLL